MVRSELMLLKVALAIAQPALPDSNRTTARVYNSRVRVTLLHVALFGY